MTMTNQSMALPVERTAEQARLMEQLGFEYLGAGEHFMRGRPPGPTHAARPLLAQEPMVTGRRYEYGAPP